VYKLLSCYQATPVVFDGSTVAVVYRADEFFSAAELLGLIEYTLVGRVPFEHVDGHGQPLIDTVNHCGAVVEPHRLNQQDMIADVDSLPVYPHEPVSLQFSPECTHFPAASGGKSSRDRERSRRRWPVALLAEGRPHFMFVENVAEFEEWGPSLKDRRQSKLWGVETFAQWRRQLEELGYRWEESRRWSRLRAFKEAIQRVLAFFRWTRR